MGSRDASFLASVPRPLFQRRSLGNFESAIPSPEEKPEDGKRKSNRADGSHCFSDRCQCVNVTATVDFASSYHGTTNMSVEDQSSQALSQAADQSSIDLVRAEPQDLSTAVWHLVTDLAAGLDDCLDDFAALKASVTDCRANMAKLCNEQKSKDATTQDIFRKVLDKHESRLKREIVETVSAALSREAAERQAFDAKMTALHNRIDEVRVLGASEYHKHAEATASLSQQLIELSESVADKHASLQFVGGHRNGAEVATVAGVQDVLAQFANELKASEVFLRGLITNQGAEIKDDLLAVLDELEARLRVESACACYTQQVGRDELLQMLAKHESNMQDQLGVVTSAMEWQGKEFNFAQGVWKHDVSKAIERCVVHQEVAADALKRRQDELHMPTENADLESGSGSEKFEGSYAWRLMDRCRIWRPSLTQCGNLDMSSDDALPHSKRFSGWGVFGLVGSENTLQSWG